MAGSALVALKGFESRGVVWIGVAGLRAVRLSGGTVADWLFLRVTRVADACVAAVGTRRGASGVLRIHSAGSSVAETAPALSERGFAGVRLVGIVNDFTVVMTGVAVSPEGIAAVLWPAVTLCEVDVLGGLFLLWPLFLPTLNILLLVILVSV